MSPKEEFDIKKYTIIRNAIPKEVAHFCYTYLILKRNAVKYLRDKNLINPYLIEHGTFGDGQVNLPVYCCHGDMSMETLLFLLFPKMQKVLERDLVMNYSYVRLYEKGSILPKHKDRPACAISTTLNLGGDIWPIYIQRDGEREDEIILNPGDLLMYQGCDCVHWRNEFQGKLCGQVFLHYDEANEESIKNQFDKRPMIGLPKYEI